MSRVKAKNRMGGGEIEITGVSLPAQGNRVNLSINGDLKKYAETSLLLVLSDEAADELGRWLLTRKAHERT